MLTRITFRSQTEMRTRRDPRGAPSSIQKNTTIAESCEYYGVKDAISQCLYPRSCSDCLAMEGCVLTGTGCMNTSDPTFLGAVWQKDYHKSLPQPGSTDDSITTMPTGATIYGINNYSVFYADNATYCSTSDPVCALCHTEFVKLAASPKTKYQVDSRFCLGNDGCVCIAMCEVPWQRYPYLDGVECVVNPPITQKPIVLQSFTSRRRDPRAPLLNIHAQTQPETCLTHRDVDVQGCARPRSCQECLSTSGCLVADNYVCADMTEYSPDRDYRKLIEPGANSTYTRFGAQFPSTNTTYCPTSDATCAKCRMEFADRATQMGDWSGVSGNAIMCVGENGCVCIEQCESPLWANQVTKSYVMCGRIRSDLSWSPLGPITVAVIVIMVLGSIHMGKKRRVRARARTTVLLRHMLDQAPTFSRNLDLFGWRDYYTTLIEKERQLLRGEENVSPMSMPAVFDYEYVEATAPELEFDEEEEASAPTVTDPRALASAPSFQARELTEANAPSAPELDEVPELDPGLTGG